MPFATDTAWPEWLITFFDYEKAQPWSTKCRYNGIYNSILHYCMEGLLVAPEPLAREEGSNTVVPLLFLIVFRHRDHKLQRLPLLIVQVADDEWLESAHTRYRADQEMRNHYNTLLSCCPIPCLWDISAMGSSVRL